jgi:DnaJ-class molecular chaperone
MIHHPDRRKDKCDAKFKEIADAYKLLEEELKN